VRGLPTPGEAGAGGLSPRNGRPALPPHATEGLAVIDAAVILVGWALAGVLIRAYRVARRDRTSPVLPDRVTP